MTEHPPGWHPDPVGRHEHRYWDGQKWTEHVADQGNLATDSLEPARTEAVAAPAGPSMINLPAISAAGTPLAAEPSPAAATPAPEPGPAQTAEQPAQPHAVSPEPAVGGVPATGPTGRPAATGALLSVVFPGAGHLFLGAHRERGLALVAATVAAGVLSYLAWPLGLIVWVVAAAAALFDLRGPLAPAREAWKAGGPLAALSGVGVAPAWRLAAIAGALLVISLLLPWYRVEIEIASLDASANVTGFQSLELLDLLLLVVGLASVAGGAAALTSTALPPWLPAGVATAGAAGAILVLYRMLFVAGGVPDEISVGRAPGVLIAFGATLTIVFGAAAAMASGRRAHM